MAILTRLLRHTKPIQVHTKRVGKDRVLIVTTSNGAATYERQTTAIVFTNSEIKKMRTAKDRLVPSR